LLVVVFALAVFSCVEVLGINFATSSSQNLYNWFLIGKFNSPYIICFVTLPLLTAKNHWHFILANEGYFG
jgi:hypothetical protein